VESGASDRPAENTARRGGRPRLLPPPAAGGQGEAGGWSLRGERWSRCFSLCLSSSTGGVNEEMGEMGEETDMWVPDVISIVGGVE
jgi:hypothetical protein